MSKALHVASAVLLALLGGASAIGARDNPQAGSAGCTSPVIMDMTGPRPAMTVTTPDGRPFPAIFDTGAMNTVVSIDFAERLGLANEGPLAPPYDKHSSGYQTSIKGMRIGTLDVPARSVPVMPVPLADKALILSPASFSGRLVRLDLAKGTLQVCSKEGAPPDSEAFDYTPPPFQLPSIPLRIAGQDLQAHFDTGSPYDIILPLRLAKTIELSEPLKQVGVVRMHSGQRPIYEARVKGNVQVGNFEIENPRVAFSEIIPGPNVGMAILRRFVVTIDPEARRSWISRPAS